MAIKLERIVKTYYDKLEEGKVLGRKCPKCGNAEWPPVYACNACGAMETEWCEMSGRGTIVELYMTTPMNAKAAYADLEPYAYAWVKCEEGPERQVMVRNITRQNEGYVRAHMPYPIQMEIVQRDGYKTAVFKIDPIDENGSPIELEEAPAKKAPAPKAAAAATAAVSYRAATLETLKGLVADSYHVDVSTLRAETSFEKELKAPSVILVGLIAKLEDEFDEMISITEASAAKTLGELAALIDKTVGNETDTVMGGGSAAPEMAVKADAAPDSKTLSILKKLAAKSYHKDEAELSADSSFEKELKGPSVILVGLISKLEDEFDMMIPLTKVSAAKTLGELAAMIDRLVSEG